MGYALGVDLDGESATIALNRAQPPGRHEQDVLEPPPRPLPLHRLVDRVGDPVPVHEDGLVVSAESAVAAAVVTAVEAVAVHEGSGPDEVTVAYPPTWGPYRTALLSAALAEAGLVDFTLLPDAVAAVLHVDRSVLDAGGPDVVAVLDLRSEHLRVTTVGSHRERDRPGTVLGHPVVVETFGASDIDDAVLAHVRAVLGPSLPVMDDAAARTLRAECARAARLLAVHPSVSFTSPGAAQRVEVRMVAAELEDRVRERAASAVTKAAEAVVAAAPGGVDRVLLLGAAASLPLLAELVALEFDAPLTVVDDDAAHAVARGAAQAARSGRTAAAPDERAEPEPSGRTRRRRAPGPSGAAEPADRSAAPHRRRPTRSTRRTRAAAMAAGGALVLAVSALAVSGAALTQDGAEPPGASTLSTDDGSSLGDVVSRMFGGGLGERDGATPLDPTPPDPPPLDPTPPDPTSPVLGPPSGLAPGAAEDAAG
ncbi:hypothetical protein [Cellulomonas fimi]|uniref:Heat shock protein 70 n=1 Tax=Cellulomonas fimi TaxID=1708 RepID=A0A7Y0QH54_CELFI|nr:hypothetical protein [Cellulomonas fimi]NMR20791.1 hypothetical protein [Cellulomonas fimi]